jgi:hypothetical protein
MRNNRLLVEPSQGFGRGVDPESARRQLHMSLGLAVLVTIATFAQRLRPGFR